MPFTLLSPIKKTFVLSKTDAEYKTEGTTITLRQATEGDFILVNDMRNEFSREYSRDDTVIFRQKISFDRIYMREAWLTLCSCNIMDDDGPLFRFKNERVSSEAEFEKAWAKLPPLVANEIIEKVMEMNPLWNDGIVSNATDTEAEKSGEE